MIAVRVALVILVALISPIATGNIAQGEESQWVVPDEYGPGFFQFVIQDPTSGALHSQLTGYAGSDTLICASLDDPFCSRANDFYYSVILPVCGSSDDSDCIRSIEAIDKEGKEIDSAFVRYANPNHPNLFTGNPSLKLPNSASPSLWEFSDSVHSFGKQMAISVGMSGNYRRGAISVGRDNFFVNLHPVSLQLGSGSSSNPDGFENYHKCIQKRDPVTGIYSVSCAAGSALNSKYNCAFHLSENGNCWVMQPFPSDLRFRVTLDLREEPVGWFHGRMKDPVIEISNQDNGVRLSVLAESTKQPVFYWGKEFKDMSKGIQDIWSACLSKGACSSGTRIANSDMETDLNKRNVLYYPRPVGIPLMEFMRNFIPDVQDKSAALRTAWNLRALSPDEMNKAPKCFQEGAGLKGVVTTNATVYSEGPPAFDGSILEYKVAAPHFTPTGDEFRGIYNLVMKSSLARCLYGFTDAPISASIEVFGQDGEKSLATTVVGEKQGWLYLAAHNFTFSSPTIRASIRQADPKEVTGTSVISSESSIVTTIKEQLHTSKRKSQIACYKGNKTKRITAVKPKCPKGWKKA